MAYDSDTRVKRVFKEIGRCGNLFLRVFDESKEDQKLWSDGGLTFDNDLFAFGSNDAAWYKKEPWIVNDKKIANDTPVIVVEGSFGTERGNTGSAQYARFSHALGAVVRDLIGVYFIPKTSEYHKRNGGVSIANWRFDMVYGCLGASQKESGEYLMIDAYDPRKLRDLVHIFATGNESSKQRMIQEIKNDMKTYADFMFKKTYRTDVVDISKCVNDKRRSYVYNSSSLGRLIMFNVVAFTNQNFRTGVRYRSGRFRNGHTIAGDILLHHYWFNKPIDMVLPRWTADDARRLDMLHQKEWNLLRLNRNVNIITLTEMDFKNKALGSELNRFMDALPLLGENLKKKFSLVKQIKKEFENGNIEIDRNRVNKNKEEGKKVILSRRRDSWKQSSVLEILN